MKHTIFFISMLVPFISFSQESSKQVISEIEDLISQYATNNDIPTINVGVIYNGNTHFINYGVYNRKAKNKTDQNSIFQIASVGKVLTGMVINDLILIDKLDPNQSILTYLPDNYPKKIKSKLKNITIRDLLNHRSGLPRQSKIINRKNDEPIIYDIKHWILKRILKK